jgi:hypothetical protein
VVAEPVAAELIPVTVGATVETLVRALVYSIELLSLVVPEGPEVIQGPGEMEQLIQVLFTITAISIIQDVWLHRAVEVVEVVEVVEYVCITIQRMATPNGIYVVLKEVQPVGAE